MMGLDHEETRLKEKGHQGHCKQSRSKKTPNSNKNGKNKGL